MVFKNPGEPLKAADADFAGVEPKHRAAISLRSRVVRQTAQDKYGAGFLRNARAGSIQLLCLFDRRRFNLLNLTSFPDASVCSGREWTSAPATGKVGPVRIMLMQRKTFAELGFPGRLIAVEGLDGSGKSTQIYLLKRWLQLEGARVFFSEWNSSELVKAATSKGKKRELLTPTTFSLIHATDFGDRYERQLVPLLRAGYLVLCDRYIFTAFARDTVRGCPPNWVRGIYNFAALPDITFFFKANLEVSLQRILDGRPQLKYFEAGMDMHLSSDPYESFRIFQGRLLEQYLAMSTEFNFVIVDANERVETQQSIVRQLVSAKINLKDFMTQR